MGLQLIRSCPFYLLYAAIAAPITIIIRAIIKIPNTRATGIHNGASTHHQDQVATAETPNSLRVINTIAKSVHKLGPLYITSGVLTVYFILDI